jgi:hypothetical protein
MAVLMFEGWDLHQERPGSGIHTLGALDWDGFPDWVHGGGGTSRGYDFGPGYNGGQALVWYRGSARGPLYVGHAVNTEMRYSFFAKPYGTPAAGTHAFLGFNHNGTNSYTAIRYVGVSNGQQVLDVGELASNTDSVGTNLSSGNVLMPADWAHYEVYVNTTTGLVEIVVDGTTQLSETLALPSTAGLANFRMHSNGSNKASWIDHIIFTDGESLRDTQGYHGIAVTWSGFGKDTGPNTGIRARINVDENTYFGTTFTMGLATVDHYSPLATNVWHQYWMTNPATSEAWGNVIDIDSWGLCRTDDTGGWLIVPSTYLSYIVMNTDGEPLVQYKAPEEALLTDPTWVKTHADRPFHEHVDNYPREMPPWDTSLIPYDSGASGSNPNPFDPTNAAADPGSKDWSAYEYDELWYEDYIGCTGPGCMVFSFSPPEPPTSYGGTGLAFAEEYRTTYKDWQSIIDGGEDFCSYFITGYKIHGEGNKKFQSNYLTVNFETDVLGSAYVQGVWDYALGNEPNEAHSRSDTGRWGTTQQIYGPRNDVSFKHAFSKLKIRGHGKALQLKVKCETGKPFYINGWAMFVSGNSTT